MVHQYIQYFKSIAFYNNCQSTVGIKRLVRQNNKYIKKDVRYFRIHEDINSTNFKNTNKNNICKNSNINNDRNNSCSTKNEGRYRKIIVISFDKKNEKFEYKNIPFSFEELNKKSKKEILDIYKTIRDKQELEKLPNDFIDNLFECTKKYVRSLLPYEFLKIHKTLHIIKKKDKQLNLLLNQQMKRIYYNFDVNSICKLFQIYTFTKSRPTNLIINFSKTVLNNLSECKSWHIRELVSIFCFFKIGINVSSNNKKENGKTENDKKENGKKENGKKENDKIREHVDYVYKRCLTHILKNIKGYDPKDITIIFYSYTKLNKQNNNMQDAVIKNVVNRINSYQFYQLGIILNCFAKIGVKNERLCRSICDKIKTKMELQQAEWCRPNEPKQTVNRNLTDNVSASVVKDVAKSVAKSVADDDAKNDINDDRGGYAIENDRDVSLSEIIEIGNNEDTKKKEQTKHVTTTESNTTIISQILKPKDVSVILNALVRLEYYDNDTFNSLIPYIVNCVTKFSPQSLSNVVHAYSKMQINNTLLLDRMINVSITKISKFKNKEMSNLANSLIRLNRKDKTFFMYLIDEFLYRATIGSHFLNYDFDILSLQQLSYSFSKVGLCDERVFFILHKQLLKKISQIHKKEKKEKKGKKEKQLENEHAIEQTSEIVTRKEDKIVKKNWEVNNVLDFFALSTFINSYGRGNMSNKNLSYFISYMIRKKKKEKEVLTNNSLTSIVYGLLKLQIKDKKLYQFLLKESKERVDYLQPTHIILLLYSFSKLKIYSKNFVKKSIQNLSRSINYLTVSDLSLTCYALSNMLYRDLIFFYKTCKIILLGNFQLNKKHVSQLFNSLTKLCFYYKPFYDYIFQKIILFLHEFSEKELTNIVFSFMYYFHMKFLNYISLQETNENNLQTKQKKNTAEEIFTQKLKKKNDNIYHNSKLEKWEQLIPTNDVEFFKNELNIFFNLIYILNEKYKTHLSLISIYQLQIVDLYLRAFFTNYKNFPKFLKIFFFKCRIYKIKIDDYIILSSKTHRNISKFLNLIGISHRSEVQFGPYQLDIVVDFLRKRENPIIDKERFGLQQAEKESQNDDEDDNDEDDNDEDDKDDADNDDEDDQNATHKSSQLNKPVVKGGKEVIEKLLHKNIVIEVDGVSHFYKESFSRTLSSIIKHFVLRKFNWHIIHIPYQEWEQCYNFKKKILYCLNIWNNIINLTNETLRISDVIHIVNEKQKKTSQKQIADEVDIEEEKGKTEKGLNEIAFNGEQQNRTTKETEIAYDKKKDEQSLPDFYKIDDETFFLNQIINKGVHKKNTMRNLNKKSQVQYNCYIEYEKKESEGTNE